MPELPEVETVVRSLKNKITDKKIISCKQITLLKRSNLNEDNLSKISNKTINEIKRIGKYILFSFLDSENFLIIHLGMAGTIALSPEEKAIVKNLIFKASLDNNLFLSFFDHRRFGQIFIFDKNECEIFFKKVAPDPFDKFWNEKVFFEKIKKIHSPIKTKLLDQSFISGIGNIYASESLFASGIHPEEKCSNITKKQAILLFENIKIILQQSIDLGGSSIKDFKHIDETDGSAHKRLLVYGKQNSACPKFNLCKGEIKKIILAQRSSFFCNSCQRLNQPHHS